MRRPLAAVVLTLVAIAGSPRPRIAGIDDAEADRVARPVDRALTDARVATTGRDDGDVGSLLP